MQRIDENADIRARGRSDNFGHGREVRHGGPGKKFQQGRQSIRFSEVRNRAEPVGQARMVAIVRCCEDVTRAERAINGSSAVTSISGVIWTSSMSESRKPVSASAALVSRIMTALSMSG